MKRRTLPLVKWFTFVVMGASAVLGWQLSDAEGSLPAVRATLFGVFTLSAFVLFVVVLADFDRWVDEVRPYPKRALRRRAGRVSRAFARLIAWLLAGYGAAATSVWSRVGAGLTSVGGGLGRTITWASVWLGRGGTWTLVALGAVLTASWAWLTRAGPWMFVRYRAFAGWLWSTTGRGSGWAAMHTGIALTASWVWLTRAGGSVVVGFRWLMTRLWALTAAVVARIVRGIGAALAVLWVWLTRLGLWLLVLFRVVMTRGWNWTGAASSSSLRAAGTLLTSVWGAVLGGAREATTIRQKRWYVSAVDSVFGVPPEDNPADTRRRPRVSRRPGSGRRGRAERPRFRDYWSTASPPSPPAPREARTVDDPRSRNVAPQGTRRAQRRASDELLSAVLARFRSAVRQPRDREAGSDE
jgi:hypothetical protein